MGNKCQTLYLLHNGLVISLQKIATDLQQWSHQDHFVRSSQVFLLVVSCNMISFKSVLTKPNIIEEGNQIEFKQK